MYYRYERHSHADLTPDYAAIPQEMKKAAECFGKDFLRRGIQRKRLSIISHGYVSCAGDRAALRALHFVCENERVKEEVDVQKNLDTRRACFAGKTKGMQVTSHIQQDKTTGLYQLLCVENSIIYSIHHMYIIMSIALYLTRIIFRWRLMR